MVKVTVKGNKSKRKRSQIRQHDRICGVFSDDLNISRDLYSDFDNFKLRPTLAVRRGVRCLAQGHPGRAKAAQVLTECAARRTYHIVYLKKKKGSHSCYECIYTEQAYLYSRFVFITPNVYKCLWTKHLGPLIILCNSFNSQVTPSLRQALKLPLQSGKQQQASTLVLV